ncbi:glycosyltransferase family 2 protein [Acetivibrio sp. MSJd-27]|uniref:glycosyltransferase family 2 protein n=1 Tax=Acetivibrio sp. MSJd-27 TaxID=2841523 RepID=UPI0015AD8D8F|nr:glycosyltransferase family 2 protein [Acetivibrio sp. MSJd-27]MBU5448995.1 glycosyltransferase family 2 protein [Acetivibrio sp. MSJd-27]
MKSMVVIPAYNEEKSIYKVVKRVQNCGMKIDVVVVNDGSEDRTSEEARRAGAIVINLPLNVGIGGAVQTGYLYAVYHGYDAVVQIDGDGQHDPVDLPNLLSKLQNGEADMVIGSRFVEKSDYKPSFFRKLGILFFSKLISLLTGEKFTDTTSGYRAVNRKVMELFAKYYPSDYPEPETIVYLKRHGMKIKEIPTLMNERKTGKSSITPLKSVYYMIKVTFCLLLQDLKGV